MVKHLLHNMGNSTSLLSKTHKIFDTETFFYIFPTSDNVTYMWVSQTVIRVILTCKKIA